VDYGRFGSGRVGDDGFSGGVAGQFFTGRFEVLEGAGKVEFVKDWG